MPRPYLHRISDVDPETRMATCAYCGRVKVYSMNHGDRKRWRCSKAVAALHSKTRRMAKYGMSDEEFQAMKEKQEGFCAAGCGNLCTHVDHDHNTGMIRGLLCHKCNAAIGMANENSEQLRRLFSYVQMANYAQGLDA